MAHDELKKCENTSRYFDVVQRLDGRASNEYTLDNKWADNVERRAASRQERLEQDLNGFKSNLIKEAIRRGQEELGDFFYERGDLQNAFKCFVRSRDYCSTSRHIVGMCLSVVRVASEMANWMHVQNYVQKAEQTPDVGAARKLVDVNVELGTSFSDVMAPQDVAMYGGLCALATFDRSELKDRVLSNIAFREFLEMVPELRDLIRDFHESRYAKCLRSLDGMQAGMRLDLHLSEHLDSLYAQIRQRAVMQYVAPFTSVDLMVMAESFNTSATKLEKEVAGLIIEGKVHARIDSHRKVLHASHADVRGQTFQQVLSAGEAYLRDTKAMLLRASLIKHDFVQPKPGGGGDRLGDRMGGMGGGMGGWGGLRSGGGPRGDRGDRGDRGGAGGSSGLLGDLAERMGLGGDSRGGGAYDRASMRSELM
ncbi:hypothetical protein FOA52_011691 [Chlamydomonas sp. UWO 241]|nr:hypothetical protein FOA52_011691 [Chlamydomonas sp. UWO 241]